MKPNRSIFSLLFLVCIQVFVNGQNRIAVSNRLEDRVEINRTINKYIPISILLNDQVDVSNLKEKHDKLSLSIKNRARELIVELKSKAVNTQKPIFDFLRSSSLVNQSSIYSLWIANVIFAEVHPDFIYLLAEVPGIELIDLDAELKLEDYKLHGKSDFKTPGGIEPGLAAINAPAMWKLGYTGYGSKVMSMDTGVDPNHQSIDNQYEGNYNLMSQSWYVLDDSLQGPGDCNGHGTHTVGIMCGLDSASNDTIGVAFEARWIGSPSLCGMGNSTSRNVAGFQWAINPDGDTATFDDMPDVINNSWYDPNTTYQCNGLYKYVLDAVEASGIAVVFSAGNQGPGDSTITEPKNINTSLVNSFCVGSIIGSDSTYPISSFSSRGPSTCGETGSLLIKPEVVAPGSNVRSAYVLGTYYNASGTSMAAPHVSGAIALLKQAFPYLTGEAIKLGLYYSSVDLGVPGEDNTFGMGVIDVYAAYNYLISEGNIPQPPIGNYDLAIVSLGNLGDPVCNSMTRPKLIVQNRGNNDLVELKVNYQFTGNLKDSLEWTGNLGYLDTAHILLNNPGLNPGYNLFEANVEFNDGIVDLYPFNNKFIHEFEVLPFSDSTTFFVCESESKLIEFEAPAHGGILWYNSEDSLLNMGNSLQTDVLAKDTTFYIDYLDTAFVGKYDSSGKGDYYISSSQYLLFDCYSPFTLHSVKLYLPSALTNSIQLRDSNGQILESVSLTLSEGEHRVVLNFNVLPGNDYRLCLVGTPGMYRNDRNVFFPYKINELVNIKGTNMGPKYYFFFYDWEVIFNSICGKTPVHIGVNSPINADFTSSSTTIDLLSEDSIYFANNTIGSANWFWDFGDGNTSILENPSHSYVGFDKSYQVALALSDENNACKDTAFLDITVDKNDHHIIYPNPSNGKFHLFLAISSTTQLDIELFDEMGKKLMKREMHQIDRPIIDLDFSHIPDGIYFLNVRVFEELFVKKVIKISN